MQRLIQLGATFAVILWAIARTSSAHAGEVRLPIGSNGGYATVATDVKSVKELREDGITLQKLDYSCGSAALSTIFTSYLDLPYSEADIIDFIVRNGDVQKILVRKGFSLLDLKNFADQHGVAATGYALEFNDLVELQCPVLVPLYRPKQNMRHFVIFRGATEDRVFLADPAVGRRTMLRSEFEEAWIPKVGMVFNHPGMPPAEQTLLGFDPMDGAYLPSDNLRAVVYQSVITYIHQANEF